MYALFERMIQQKFHLPWVNRVTKSLFFDYEWLQVGGIICSFIFCWIMLSNKLYIGSTRYNWPFVYIKSFCVFYILLFIMFFIGTIYTSHTQEYPQIHYYHPPFKLCLLLFNHNYHSLPSYHKGQRITSLVICSSTIPSTYIRFNGTSAGS